MSPYLEEALPFCPFGTFPHTVGNHPPRRAEPARPQLPAARILQPICLNHKQKTDLQALLQARFFNPLSSSFSSSNRTAHNCNQSQHCQNNSCNQSNTGTMIQNPGHCCINCRHFDCQAAEIAGSKHPCSR